VKNLFEIAARRKFRFTSSAGALTTEQLFDLPLTSTTGKANLNAIAISLADAIDQAGARSFVSSASANPGRVELEQKLEVVKLVIATIEGENAARADERAKREELARLDEAIAAADAREMGAQSAADLRAKRAALTS
jgi:hypothetical protein